jgi:hypothetical protein
MRWEDRGGRPVCEDVGYVGLVLGRWDGVGHGGEICLG